MFMMHILCIRKRGTVSYLQYVYDLEISYQKERNCFIPTVCLYFRLCVSEKEKLYHTNSMFMLQILCIRKRETVSYLQYVYILDFVFIRKRETVSYQQYVYVLGFMYQKEGNCSIPTICLYSRLICIKKRENSSYSMFMNYFVYHVSALNIFQKDMNNCFPT